MYVTGRSRRYRTSLLCSTTTFRNFAATRGAFRWQHIFRLLSSSVLNDEVRWLAAEAQLDVEVPLRRSVFHQPRSWLVVSLLVMSQTPFWAREDLLQQGRARRKSQGITAHLLLCSSPSKIADFLRFWVRPLDAGTPA
jgi:hypothetical protein